MFRIKWGFSFITAALVTSSALAAPVRIDFSGNTPPTLPPTGPGFRISNQTNTDTPNVSETFELGSNLPNNGDGLNYLRITSSTSATGGVDVQNFIVVVPELHISDIGMTGGIDGDMYGLSFAGGQTSVANGFAIYNAADTLLTTPLFLANITLVDTFLVISESGFVEGTPGAIGLSNMHLANTGGLFPTLVEFLANGAGGADFTARINSAGTNISTDIQNRLLVEGSSNGSIESIPEPGTILLTAAGIGMLLRRKARNAA